MSLEPSLSSTRAGTNGDFDDFFGSPIDFPELEALYPNTFVQGNNEVAEFIIPNDINFGTIKDSFPVDHPNASEPCSPSYNGQALSTCDTSVSGASDSTCCCLMQALDLMKNLSSTNPPARALSNSPENAIAPSNRGNSNYSPAQAVVMENKQTIEAVINMLQCSCAEDGYLPTLLSMIVFKMLGRYAAAAGKQSQGESDGGDKPNMVNSTSGQMRQFGSPSSHNENVRRMAAQSILSELHRVQQLMNQLSPRLKSHGPGAASQNTERGTPDPKGAGQTCRFASIADGIGETPAAPFSANTLEQIEVDLRNYLRSLSSEIIHMLRQS